MHATVRVFSPSALCLMNGFIKDMLKPGHLMKAEVSVCMLNRLSCLPCCVLRCLFSWAMLCAASPHD